MAGLPSIDTGYKPEFALGALYHGFNAGNADQSAQQEIIRQFLANQRDQATLPLDLRIKAGEAAKGDFQASDEGKDAYSKLQTGQALSNYYAGKKAEALSPSDIALGQQTNTNDLWMAKIQARLNDLRQGQLDVPQEQGSIGFPMQGVETPNQIGFPLTSEAKMKASMVDPNEPMQTTRRDMSYDVAELTKALSVTKDPKIRATLQAELNKIKAGSGGTGMDAAPPSQGGNAPLFSGMINTNNSPLVSQPPLRNGGFQQGTPEEERLLRAMYDTPKFRQELIKDDQKLDSDEYQTRLKMEAQIEAAKHHTGFEKDPKTAQETMQRILKKKQSGQPLTPLDIEVYNVANETYNASLAAKVQPGPTLDTTSPQLGKIFKEKPDQPKSPPLQENTAQTAPAPRKLSDEQRAALIKSLTQGK